MGDMPHPKGPSREDIRDMLGDSKTWRNPMRLSDEAIEKFPKTDPKRRDRHGDGLAEVKLTTKGPLD